MFKFKTINKTAEGYFADKCSKFPTYAFEVYNEKQIKDALSIVKEKHPKATHHCYAYKLGMDDNNYRANDDGEPSGSAGRPILGQIYSNELTNVLIIVVRYYGGTKLGVSGLINAYKKSTQDAINNSKIVEKELQVKIEIICDYLKVNDLLNYLKKVKVENLKQDYSEECVLSFTIGKSKMTEICTYLENKSFKFTVEE